MGISQAEFARRMGVSPQAVSNAKANGNIPLDEDGKIDPEAAEAAWNANVDQRRKGSDPGAHKEASSKGGKKSAAKAKGEEKQKQSSKGKTGGKKRKNQITLEVPEGMDLNQARTANEVYKAQQARLDLQKKQGELLDRQKAEQLAFDFFRQERDAWISWPSRIAPEMASQLGVDPHRMQQLLDEYVRQHLDEIADTEVDFVSASDV